MFQLTLRDLFWLTVVAALIVAWWIDHWRMDAHLRPWLQWEQGGRKRVAASNHNERIAMNSRATIVAIGAFLTGGFGGFMLQPGYGRLGQIRIQNEGLREQVRLLEKQIALLEAGRDEVLEGK